MQHEKLGWHKKLFFHFVKKKSKYKNNLSGLPRDYEKVDNALKPFFESITSDNLAIQDMIDNPDDYGLNDAP